MKELEINQESIDKICKIFLKIEERKSHLNKALLTHDPNIYGIQKQKKLPLTMKNILQAKRLIPAGAVVYELDKNTNVAYVECPKRLEQRIQKEIINSPAFKETKIQPCEALEKMWKIYKNNDLKKFIRLDDLPRVLKSSENELAT